MSEPGIRRAIIAVVAAVLAAGLFTKILLETRPRAEFWEWLITLAGTGLAALFAVGVFEYQSRQNERDRQKKLLVALAAELQSNLDIIRSEHRTPFITRDQRPGAKTRYVKYADAKLVPMPPIVAEAAIRSGVFDAHDVYLLTRIVRGLHIHNSEVSYLLSIRSNPDPGLADAVIATTKDRDGRQKTIEKGCKELIEFLREQEGIEVPISLNLEDDNRSSSK